MICNKNMIAQKGTSIVISDTKKRSHSSYMIKQRGDVGGNKQWWKWYRKILLRQDCYRMWFRTIKQFNVTEYIIIYSNNMIAQQSTFDVISDPNKYLHLYVWRKQTKTTENKNIPWQQWYGTITLEWNC